MNVEEFTQATEQELRQMANERLTQMETAGSLDRARLPIASAALSLNWAAEKMLTHCCLFSYAAARLKIVLATRV